MSLIILHNLDQLIVLDRVLQGHISCFCWGATTHVKGILPKVAFLSQQHVGVGQKAVLGGSYPCCGCGALRTLHTASKQANPKHRALEPVAGSGSGAASLPPTSMPPSGLRPPVPPSWSGGLLWPDLRTVRNSNSNATAVVCFRHWVAIWNHLKHLIGGWARTPGIVKGNNSLRIKSFGLASMRDTMMRNIETFHSKQMYLYLSLVERKVAWWGFVWIESTRQINSRQSSRQESLSSLKSSIVLS